MQLGDTINGSFELVGACFTWMNTWRLYRDRSVAGVYWPAFAFFAAWGLWNLWYYPSLGQSLSFMGGLIMCSGNVAWILHYARLSVLGRLR